MRNAALVCHPSTPCSAIRQFAVEVQQSRGRIVLNYRIEGDIGALAIPQSGPSHRVDGLWQNTCLEAFVKGSGEVYYEFNFAPSSAWTAYRFTSYRQGREDIDKIEPAKITVHRDLNRFELEAVVGNPNQPLMFERGNGLRLGLSAVVKDNHGGLSYWAIAHPKDQPDFHHPDSFAFELEWLKQPAN